MLAPIRRQPKRRNFSVYDLEWYPHTLELRMIGVYDGEQYRHYTDIGTFLNSEFTQKNEGKWYYAHAGGLYDLRFILEYLLSHPNPHVRIEASFSGSSAIIVKVSKGKRSWYLLDSYWLLREKLRKIGKWVGIDKGGDTNESRERCAYPETACTCDPIFFAPLETLIEYNRDDCLILWKAIERFEHTLLDLGGELMMTCASSAMRLFRMNFLKDTIRTRIKINELARFAYIASRVEVFEKQCGEANYFDINSSFPYAMTFDAPGNLRKSINHLPEQGIYLARCKVKIPDCAVPPLPYRSKDRRIYFPTGTWEQWFSNIDIELLVSNGGKILECSEALLFDPFDDLKSYAETVYELRRKATDEGVKAILKILLNSLYGKFAEGSDKTKLLINPAYHGCQHLDARGNVIHPNNECLELLMPGVWLVHENRDIPHAHVPISMHITSIARKVLYEYIAKCDRVYYCDTDGFACPISNQFDIGDKLGGLKLEKVVRRGIFAAAKLYALEQKTNGSSKGYEWMVKAKGFSKLTYSQFCELLENKEVRVDKFSRIKEGLRAGQIAPSEGPVMKRFLDQVRSKRYFYPDGSSRPWDVSEIENDQ